MSKVELMSKSAHLSVLALVMINVIAIGSLRGIPLSASFGLAIVTYYLIAALLFFIPSALVAAELTTAWPVEGGVYTWIREAFGRPLAFCVIFIQWMYNIFWYPTILALFAATFAYTFAPNLVHHPGYTLTIILAIYWLLTLLSLRGMKLSGTISTITALLGTLFPMALIIILGLFWLLTGHAPQIPFSTKALFPHQTIAELPLLTGVIYNLVGMEMSAVHVRDVANPQRNYPRALFYSTIVILVSLIATSLAVAVVIPPAQLNLVTGLLDAFRLFLHAFGLEDWLCVVAFLIMIGILGSVMAWMVGPTRGMAIAAEDHALPAWLGNQNRAGMPQVLLLFQGIIFSLVSFAFVLMPSINSSFWLLSDLTAELALSTYIFIFAAALRLRYKYPHQLRTFSVPGGNFGMWTITISGILASIFTILIGFIPPSQLILGKLSRYYWFLGGGFIGFYLLAIMIFFGFNLQSHTKKIEKTGI